MDSKRVVVGVTGGIAAYKALDVISGLRKQNVEVKVIMTESAAQFVNPLTFQSLSQNMVVTDMFSEPKAWEIQHISLAQWADLMLIVPATANIIGKVANGIADDMLSTTIMACPNKIMFAPAMNTNMYENRMVQDNIKKLQNLGFEFIEPDSGRLACGDIGKGKLAKVEDILNRTMLALNGVPQDLKGKNILISAGPTIAPIDPVRFLTNRSTGKMGYAIAEEAVRRGAKVTLVSGPTSLEIPRGVNAIRVNTNGEMKEAIEANFETADIIIKSAAVADYKIKNYSDKKIKKGDGDLNLIFERDSDILKSLGDKKKDQILVGFAAESNDLIQNATKKLLNKNLDYIVANDITASDTGFGSDENKVIIISKDGEKHELAKMTKKEVASNLFDLILGKR